MFLAVYEHGIARLRADLDQLTLHLREASTPAVVVSDLVAAIARLLLRHRGFLGAVVLISASHPEVRRRGSGYSRELGDQFAAALRPVAAQIDHSDTDAAIRSCFTVVFAAVVFRIAYGPDFAAAGSADAEAFTDELCDLAVRYLLR